MKAFTFIIALSVFNFAAAIAQTPIFKDIKPPRAIFKKSPCLKTNLNQNAIERSTTTYRLIAEADYEGIGNSLSPSDSIVYTYTGSNNKSLYTIDYTEEYFYDYNGTNYDNGDKQLQTFNSNGTIATNRYYYWLSGDQTYLYGSLDTNYYNSTGDDTASVTKYWLLNGNVLANTTKYVATYNSNHYYTFYENYNWDTTTSEWVPVNDTFFGYDSKNNIISQIIANWSGTEWDTLAGAYLILEHLNAQGEDTFDITLDFNTNTSQWDTGSREYNAYDTNGYLISSLAQNRYSTASTWRNYEYAVYEYDNNNNNTSYVLQMWDTTSSAWVNDYKDTTIFNSNNLPTFNENLNWNDTGFWEPFQELTASYHYYQEYTAGVSQLAVTNNQLTIYPNPTGGEINIVSTKPINAITVTNLLGQTVLKSPSGDLGVTQFTFELKDEGMYFVTVTADGETTTQKVVVSK